MTTIIIIAAINWLTIPVAGLVVSLLTWSWPYAFRVPMVVCRASKLLAAITNGITRFPSGVRSFAWGCWMFTFGPDLRDRSPVVNISAREDRKLVKHEANHGKWALILGLAFFVAYLVGALIARAKGGNWHDDNFWEVIAVRAEDK